MNADERGLVTFFRVLRARQRPRKHSEKTLCPPRSLR